MMFNKERLGKDEVQLQILDWDKECEKDMKLNICSNKELHRTDLMSKLITKNKLNIEDKKIIFSSFNNEKEDD